MIFRQHHHFAICGMQVAGSAGRTGNSNWVRFIALHKEHLAHPKLRAARQAAPQIVARIAKHWLIAHAAIRTGIFSQHASSAHASASCSVAGHHPRAWTAASTSASIRRTRAALDGSTALLIVP